MEASDECLALIKSCEALRLTAYKPTHLPNEPWTIGYGHTDGVEQGMTITEQVADALLAVDARAVENALDPLLRGLVVTQGMYDALVSLTFNLRGGPRALPHAAPKLYAALRSGQKQAAAAQFLDMDHENGVVLAGLKARREKEAALYLS
jgi:lysozyme